MKYALIFLLICTSFSSWAQAKWVINRDHSEVLFQVEYLAVSEVTGRVGEFSGELQFDAQSAPSALNVQLKVESLSTANTLRDGHIKAHDFLFAKKYPFIRFSSEKIVPLRATKFRAQGLLEIRGVSRPHAIEFDLVGPLKDTWGHESRFAKFSTVLSRKEFGIQWNKTVENNQYLVGDAVRVWGQLQLQLTSDKTASTKHLIPDTPAIRAREKVLRGEAVAAPTTASAVTSESFRTSVDLAVVPVAQPVLARGAPERSTIWWVSFIILGMLGFLASVVLGLYSKKLFLEYFKERYNEEGRWGQLSDFAVIAFVMAYAVTYFIVGWEF
ncbi:MAG: YceI family protein [Bacteriovoracia bacterium]